MNGIYIGTSGWVYKGWEKVFYPEDLPAKKQFQFYTTQFPTVEINATFYRLPTLKTTKNWRDQAPPGFVFAVKGSRFITHMKQLHGVVRGLERYFARLRPLEKRIGPVLWQLPPHLKKDATRLEKFLERLPKRYAHAFEFRHRSWFADDVFKILRRHNAALVAVSSLKMPMNLAVTADFIYLRFHGLKDGPYHDYTRAELQPWARHIRAQARAGRTVFAYFNNDLNVRAPENAKLLMEMAGPRVVKPPPRV